MKKTKFDLLFEDIMNTITDKEQFGSDIHNSILKIYKKNSKGFSDLIQEIDNFKFLEPSKERQDEINELTIEEENLLDVDADQEVCKIVVFDKETNKALFEVITLLGADSNDIIDMISYIENPRGTFQGV